MSRLGALAHARSTATRGNRYQWDGLSPDSGRFVCDQRKDGNGLRGPGYCGRLKFVVADRQVRRRETCRNVSAEHHAGLHGRVSGEKPGGTHRHAGFIPSRIEQEDRLLRSVGKAHASVARTGITICVFWMRRSARDRIRALTGVWDTSVQR